MQNLIRRLKNLWEWSAYAPGSAGAWVSVQRDKQNAPDVGVAELIRNVQHPKRAATIVEMSQEEEEFKAETPQ